MTEKPMSRLIEGVPARRISRRQFFQGAAAAGISAGAFVAVSGLSAAPAAARAGALPAAVHIAWEAYLQAGTCEAPDPSTRLRLGDPVYGVPVGAEGTPTAEGDEPIVFQPVGPGPLLPVLTGTATIPMALEDLYATPHHVVIESLNLETDDRVALACGNVNGVPTNGELLFGLQALLADTSGIVWMRSTAEGETTVTVFVTQGLAAGGYGMIHTPEAGASPTAPAEETAAPTEAAATEAAPTEAAPTEAAATETAPAGGAEPVTELEVGSYDIYFVPKEFTIPANTDVTVHLPNYGMIGHNFSITDHKNPDVQNLGIDVDLNPGDNKTITINAPAGNYYYYCNVPGHEAAGMWGNMYVV